MGVVIQDPEKTCLTCGSVSRGKNTGSGSATVLRKKVLFLRISNSAAKKSAFPPDQQQCCEKKCFSLSYVS
jgi:hypothetical protein